MMSLAIFETIHEETPVNTLLSLRNLKFSWSAERPLLAINHLDIAAGERLFIQGPSGSGKSTLLSLIGGVVLPNEGDVQLLGRSLVQMRSSARDRLRADHVGFIFQQFNLIPYLNAIENVLLACRFSPRRRAHCSTPRDEALRLLSHLGLKASEHLYPPVNKLSIGQQQRVAAARALIGRPELIVVDEPTSALDAPMRQVFLDLLFDECHASGAALLFVSHDESLAADFDRVIRLEHP